MTRPLLDPERIARLAKARDAHAICDHCLGRLVARIETGFGNDERGAIVRTAMGAAEAVDPDDCDICDGLFNEPDSLAEVAAEAIEPFEFHTFLVGTRIDEEVTAREVALRAEVGIPDGEWEAANTSLNREVGKRVNARWPDTKVDFKNPHIAVIVDTRYDVTELQHGGLMFFGRYRKLERGIPQTVWPCRRCRGRGCERCDGTGKMYQTSVQEIVQTPALEVTRGTEAAFHGAGREDVDARCIGTGRPFVLEIKDPRIRTVDPKAIEAAVNASGIGRVEIEGLRFAEKKEVRDVKEHRGNKTYRAEVRFAEAVPADNLNKAVLALRGAAVAQRTPVRVGHRRADLVRNRHVHDIQVEAHDAETATIMVVGDAGLYIKELIHGDEGRTDPNLAALLGVAASVEALDILRVEYDDPAPVTPN